MVEDCGGVVVVKKFSGQIKHQNCSHSIVVESLAELIADDERNGTRVLDFFDEVFGVTILGISCVLCERVYDKGCNQCYQLEKK